MMAKIAVTGGSGKLGSEVVKELRQLGYEVVSLDSRKSDGLHARQLTVDLNDFGQVVSALEGAEGIIHLAAIPAPLGYTYPYIFANNTMSTYHILEAASLLGIRKAVIGSSESSYGFAWAPKRFSPDYLPLDEDHPQQPQECYGLSKVVNELTAATFHRRNGMQVVSMRYSLITLPGDYSRLAISKPEQYKHILWSYIDIRDALSATVAALETDRGGAACLNITSSDTLSDRPTQALLDEFYPDVTDRRRTFEGREAVVSNRTARELLGWSPVHSWADGE